jgi:hypothetical protein
VVGTTTLSDGERVRVPKPLAEIVRNVVDNVKEIAEQNPDDVDEVVSQFKKSIALVPILSRPTRKQLKQVAHSGRDDENSRADFILNLARLCSATEFLRPLPRTVIAAILRDVKAAKGKPPEKLVQVILANTRKLEEAYEEITLDLGELTPI